MFAVKTGMLSPMLLPIFLLVVLVGTGILTIISKKKWGYTKKREQELENSSLEQIPKLRKGGNHEKNRFFNKRR